MWSLSTSRLFEKCQRQWFYKAHVANARATNNELQREAYILSKLQSIAAWRGKIVDYVITKRIVPDLENRKSLNADQIVEYAQNVFDKQREFALLNRIREAGMTQTAEPVGFAALYPVEYGLSIPDEDFAQAWSDIERALDNLLSMRELLSRLRSAERLIPQRNLTFSMLEVQCRAVPDLIAFFRNRPPLVVDWKVHAFGTKDYRRQLALYALALTSCHPHADFPPTLSNYSPIDIELLEVQLLTIRQRDYKLTAADIDEAESYIARSAMEIDLAVGDETAARQSPFDFPVTEFVDTCAKCSYRALCWKEPTCQESRQMTFL
jgi:PD-(D/E)XK nuclease superfamily